MKLDHYRRKSDLTQQDIADALGVAPATICRYERSARTPDLRTIRKIKAMTGGAVTEDDWAPEVEP